MDDFLAELMPPADDDFLAKVTSKEWRRELAGRLTPVILDAAKAMEWYVSRGHKPPVSISLMVLRDLRQPVKPRGRPAGTTPDQMAYDIACYFAVEFVKKKDNLKLTPACKKVAEETKIGLCQQAVFNAYRREERRLQKNTG